MVVTSAHGGSEEVNPCSAVAQGPAMGDGGLELWPYREWKSPRVCCPAGDRGPPTSAYMQDLGTCKPPSTPSCGDHGLEREGKEKERGGESQKPRAVYRNVLSISPNPCLANSRCSINMCSV